MDESTEKLIDMKDPILSTNDILYRGTWSGPVISEDMLERAPWHVKWGSRLLMKALGAQFIEKTRQPVPAFLWRKGTEVRVPDYKYSDLMKLSKNHWLLRQIFRAIIGEVLNPRWEIKPRFKRKCRNCGREFSKKVEECDICGKKRFDKPSVDQFKIIQGLLKRPSQDRTFVEFFRSTLWYLLALDDAYWEIGHTRIMDVNTKQVKRIPRGLRALDGAITLPVQDEFGNFNSNEYFCPICYLAQFKEYGGDEGAHVKLDSLPPDKRRNPKCKKCGSRLFQTAYVQKKEGTTIARFAKDEVIHISSSRVDPEPFGISKVMGCLKHLLIIDWMDEYDLQTISHGHVNKLIVFPDADKVVVSEIKETILNQMREQMRVDPQTGEAQQSLEPIMAFLGTKAGKEPKAIDLMPTAEEMQSVEKYRLRVEKVSGVFGVSPIFTNTAEPESSGALSRPRIDVQNRVTRGYMNDLEDPFNDVALAAFGVTDWVIRFGKIESRDMLREAQIKLTNMQAVSLAIASGFEVEVAEDALDYSVSMTPMNPPENRSRLESGKIPQDLDGAPERTMPSGRGGGVPLLEPEVNESEK